MHGNAIRAFFVCYVHFTQKIKYYFTDLPIYIVRFACYSSIKIKSKAQPQGDEKSEISRSPASIWNEYVTVWEIF